MTKTMPASRMRRIAHPEWVKDAAVKVANVTELYGRGSVPAVIEVWMIIVPTKRLLRGVYGSDLRAALALLWMALKALPGKGRSWMVRTWRYKILLRDPEDDMNRMLTAMEAEDAAEGLD